MGSSGTAKQQQTTQTQSSSEPWKPTKEPLKNIIGQIGGQLGNTGITANEQGALDQLRANAQAGNPYTGQIESLTNDLFTGGIDRTGIAQNAYDAYQKQAQPYLDPSYLDPAKNPHFNAYTTQLADSAANRVNGMFAAAGRDFSGANMSELGRGITEATLPVFANQYNQNVATQTGLMNNLFNAGGQTAGLLSGLDQTALGNRVQGVGAAAEALGAKDYAANKMLGVEGMQRNMPLQNIGNVSSLLLPIAGLGGQQSGSASSQGTYTQPLAQTAMQWTNVAKNALPAAQSVGGTAQYLGGIFSDRRLKEDIKRVGTLDNGLPVYSYRYAWGGPVVIGVMADEVEKVAPEAVGEVAGFKTVNYDLAVRV